MDIRGEQERRFKGLELAQRIRIVSVGDRWLVPSDSASDVSYAVTLSDPDVSCSCPDFELRRQPCKHIFAVIASVRMAEDGNANVKKKTSKTEKAPPRTAQRYKKCTQDWPAYDLGQDVQQDYMQVLLRGLCDCVIDAPQPRGRPRVPNGDIIFANGMRLFWGTATRFLGAPLRHCVRDGYLTGRLSRSTVCDGLGSPSLTPVLREMLRESARPIAHAELERHFAFDATVYSTRRYERWVDKQGRNAKLRWAVKLHVGVGVKTHIIVASEVSNHRDHDSPYLPGLLEQAARDFRLQEVSADKGYIGRENFEAIESYGAEGFIPPRSNTRFDGPPAWQRHYGRFLSNPIRFVEKYHLRSNVEAVFSAMKRRFGNYARSKVSAAQTNELFLRCLIWNLSVLTMQMVSGRVRPTFFDGDRYNNLAAVA